MVTSSLNGGLGNKFFQIACAVSLAMDNNDIYAFDFDDKVKMQGESARNYRNNIYFKLRELPKKWKPECIYRESWASSYQPIDYKPNILLEGYFQCEKYFINNRNFIKKLFRNEAILEAIKWRYRNILDNSVAIHVRRGDYVNLGETLDGEYYDTALDLLLSYVKTANLLVFSDDIKWCIENFKYKDRRFYFIKNDNSYEDFYLMVLCSHFITANSSFSWWGSYLSSNPEKVVLMPRPWTTSIGDDIYPEGVIQIY